MGPESHLNTVANSLAASLPVFPPARSLSSIAPRAPFRSRIHEHATPDELPFRTPPPASCTRFFRLAAVALTPCRPSTPRPTTSPATPRSFRIAPSAASPLIAGGRPQFRSTESSASRPRPTCCSRRRSYSSICKFLHGIPCIRMRRIQTSRTPGGHELRLANATVPDWFFGGGTYGFVAVSQFPDLESHIEDIDRSKY